ncbi:MAG: DUF4386 domain-containing protein [Dehalococcoidia bacterium]|nr:DUF4386 domain-containing protein [Dehalococcoidia bacterium]
MSEREAAVVLGGLYVLATGAGLLSVAPSVDGPDYLERAAARRGQVRCAALFQFAMGALYAGIGVLWYPLLDLHDQWLAAGVLSFRLLAGGFVFLGAVVLLLVLAVSEDATRAGGSNEIHVRLGEVLRTARDLVNHVAMILALSVGGVLLSSALFEGELVPRWLAAWGLAGAVLAAVGSVLVLLRTLRVLSRSYVAMNLPLAVQELALAAWLVARGL